MILCSAVSMCGPYSRRKKFPRSAWRRRAGVGAELMEPGCDITNVGRMIDDLYGFGADGVAEHYQRFINARADRLVKAH